MRIADGIGLDVGVEIFEHRGKFTGMTRQRGLKMLANMRRRILPDRAFARGPQKIDHAVQRFVAMAAKRLPILRVEILTHCARSKICPTGVSTRHRAEISVVMRTHLANSWSIFSPHREKALSIVSPATTRSAMSLISGALAQTRSPVRDPMATGCPR